MTIAARAFDKKQVPRELECILINKDAAPGQNSCFWGFAKDHILMLEYITSKLPSNLWKSFYLNTLSLNRMHNLVGLHNVQLARLTRFTSNPKSGGGGWVGFSVESLLVICLCRYILLQNANLRNLFCSRKDNPTGRHLWISILCNTYHLLSNAYIVFYNERTCMHSHAFLSLFNFIPFSHSLYFFHSKTLHVRSFFLI